ncbi:hypothetical protein N8I74_18850 [Chitiniphilus purpureus]|uniref:Uncharacterized protein n=1 Tax=Chitiniphilus purpureus TaxID=2981137 RepID=A0ABY6DV16_9NEIS|nr:hypothetical protein [Chitiniphilus sp. CD1]UXY17351.1 hypothetical protein N8I74_18850 [Chitiniphilus sp. CD1]
MTKRLLVVKLVQMASLVAQQTAQAEKVLIFHPMEKNPMKPSTTESFEGRRPILEFKIDGIAKQELLQKVFVGNSIVGYKFPIGHSPRACWILELFFLNKSFIRLSSVCTQIKDWHEIGSLVIEFFPGEALENSINIEFEKHSVSGFYIESVEKIIYEDEDVIAENGIAFSSQSGLEFIVAVGESPGSVSFAAPNFLEELHPEIPIAMCQRKPLE